MSVLDWLLGPQHHYHCHFGHSFTLRGHRLSRYQACWRCSEIGFDVEAREITKEKARA